MTVEVGGAGTIGLAFESTLGTYVAPTKWVPVRSESLQLVEDKVYRMNLRGKADRTGAIQGYQRVEGDLVFEVSSDVLVYLLYASRVTPAKTGAMAPYTYTFIPAHVAKTSTAASGPTLRRSLSVLATRSQNPMGYAGLSTSQLAFSLDTGVLVCTASMVGTSEAAQSAGTPSYPAQTIYGPGKITLEVPTATVRADADTFSLTINDNAIAANRLNGQRSAAYVNWGEREIAASMEVDFDPLTDFNDFTAQTFRTWNLKAVNSASDQVVILLSAAVNEAMQMFLAALGEVNRAAISYHGIFDTTDAYTITVITSENIT